MNLRNRCDVVESGNRGNCVISRCSMRSTPIPGVKLNLNGRWSLAHERTRAAQQGAFVIDAGHSIFNGQSKL